MMGFLDEITKAGTRLLGGEGSGGLMEQVLGLVNNPDTGGLTGLIETFKNKGLGDVVSSWISTGENNPVSGDEVTGALGSDTIRQIAEKLGISESDASSRLAELLPQVIDKLTPDGSVPEGGLLDQALGILKQKLSG
ncbi:MAG: DUF937 domain-containing protein [Syntrophorhabdaceae bacterium]|nr:DUF937 domain-containing protein [Syntrophorhabdaceae bacterium]